MTKEEVLAKVQEMASRTIGHRRRNRANENVKDDLDAGGYDVFENRERT